MSLDLIQTVALAGIVLFAGYLVRRVITPLATHNIPAPVVGGLLVSVLLTLNRSYVGVPIALDTTLQSPLMIAFFTSIGFAASLTLLRAGGPAVLLFFALATGVGVVQNVAGAATALALDQSPLLGVLAGSPTMLGGPATALAFAPFFEEAGVPAAATLGIAAAMAGIVAGGLIGGPIGTYLVRRARDGRVNPTEMRQPVAGHVVEAALPDPPSTRVPEGEDTETYDLLKAIVVILAAMWFGAWVSQWLVDLAAGAGFRLTLPAYIGAMLVAALFRNIDDLTSVFGLSQKIIDDLGNAALSLFLVLALMNLQLEQLAGLATPLAIMLIVQIAIIAIIAPLVVWRMMGRDYEAAVMSGGFVGFGLGTSANAMANMTALVERYGPAPKAFLVVPMVGAFFIDFTNALVITGFLNYFR